ncbi:MAG: ATP-dependent Clp protease proteolytic subunit [Lachnospiraceae bacterium]|nr:ATP-dependent Clp protease proteolytic subunit [Lachnospiraceae bacterium]
MKNITWNPAVEVTTHAGTKEVDLMTKHYMKRRVFIQGEINSDSVHSVLIQLMHLVDTGNEPINIYINSGGGEVTSGLLLYDFIQSIPCPVNMYCTGIAASMAAVLFAGGQKGRRFILPHSKVMIHEPLLSNGVGGSATSIKNISDSIIETRNIINGILANHTGKTKEEIDEATRFDNYMNAEQSVEFGLCDQVVTKLM